MSQVDGRWARAGWKILAVSAAFVVAGTACVKMESSSSGNNSGGTTTVFVQNFTYHGMPATLPAGIHQILFQNRESFPITHEMIPIALPEGKTAQDVIDAAKADGATSEDDWLHIGGDFGSVDTGAGIVEILNLPAGNYAVACWQTGTQTGGEDGPPHAAKGMVFGFTVS
jgi:hypothetical protein